MCVCVLRHLLSWDTLTQWEKNNIKDAEHIFEGKGRADYDARVYAVNQSAKAGYLIVPCIGLSYVALSRPVMIYCNLGVAFNTVGAACFSFSFCIGVEPSIVNSAK